MARHPDLVAQVDLESELHRLSGLLDQATSKILYREVRAAKARTAYEVAFARRLLSIEAKTVAEREARATIDVADELQAYRIAEAVASAAKEAARNFRSQMSAVQTVAANQRFLLERAR